jgi:hypothetical protein
LLPLLNMSLLNLLPLPPLLPFLGHGLLSQRQIPRNGVLPWLKNHGEPLRRQPAPHPAVARKLLLRLLLPLLPLVDRPTTGLSIQLLKL